MIYRLKSNKTSLGFARRGSSYKIKWKIGIDGGGIIYMPYTSYIFTDTKTDKIEIKVKDEPSIASYLFSWLKK